MDRTCINNSSPCFLSFEEISTGCSIKDIIYRLSDNCCLGLHLVVREEDENWTDLWLNPGRRPLEAPQTLKGDSFPSIPQCKRSLDKPRGMETARLVLRFILFHRKTAAAQNHLCDSRSCREARLLIVTSDPTKTPHPAAEATQTGSPSNIQIILTAR